tara:strand:+ start:461 stop:2221 length:1761 start_codon:yes stop_codon:yes gene_type:complete
MKRNYTLVLTNQYQDVKSDQHLLTFNTKKPFSKLNFNFETISFQELSKKEIYNRYEFCDKIYNSLFQELVIKLNFLHGISYSSRSWSVIIGTWLREFIQKNYKIFIQLEYVFKNYNITKVHALDHKDYNFCVNDTISFRHICADEEWFYLMCSKMTRYFNYSQNILLNSPKNNSYKIPSIFEEKKNQNNFIKKKIFKFFFIITKILKFFIRVENYAVIKNTYLPFLYEKMLELKFNQIPLNWPEYKINYYKKDKNLRSDFNLKIDKENSIFENYLRTNLFEFLPKHVLENFINIKEKSESGIYPKNPKFIFTSGSFLYDEVFKAYAAGSINKKIPFYIGQHGNNYFTQIHHNYVPELKFADKFITWGTKKNYNFESAFNFKILGRSHIPKNEGKLIIMFPWVSRASYYLHTDENEILNKIQSNINVIKKLNLHIKKNTILRFNRSYYENFFGIKYIDLFKDLGVECDNGSNDIRNLFKKSRLTLFTYDSTGILENFNLNIPTIFFEEKKFMKNINDDYINKYTQLLNNKIMFTSEKDLVEHINLKWNNISDWWMNEDNQRVISEFNIDFNNKSSKQSLNKLKKILN